MAANANNTGAHNARGPTFDAAYHYGAIDPRDPFSIGPAYDEVMQRPEPTPKVSLAWPPSVEEIRGCIPEDGITMKELIAALGVPRNHPRYGTTRFGITLPPDYHKGWMVNLNKAAVIDPKQRIVMVKTDENVQKLWAEHWEERDRRARNRDLEMSREQAARRRERVQQEQARRLRILEEQHQAWLTRDPATGTIVRIGARGPGQASGENTPTARRDD